MDNTWQIVIGITDSVRFQLDGWPAGSLARVGRRPKGRPSMKKRLVEFVYTA